MRIAALMAYTTTLLVWRALDGDGEEPNLVLGSGGHDHKGLDDGHAGEVPDHGEGPKPRSVSADSYSRHIGHQRKSL